MVESRKRAVLVAASLDFPSIAGGETAELTISNDNARAGDVVALGPPAFLDVGLTATGYVNASNEIVVRLHNTTASAIDPSAGAQLTVGEDVTGEEASSGTLTIAEPLIDTDQFTVGTIEYTMKTTPAAAYDIALGAGEAASKVNIVAAINASGTEGVEYFAGTLINADVSASAFSGDVCTLTAKVEGVAGDSVVIAETGNELDDVSNVFLFQETFVDEVNNVFAGATEAAAKVNLVAAINADGGTPGTTHFTSQVVNPLATAAAFSGDDSLVTATTAGFAGNSIATTETFADGGNVFDATTLGEVTLGADAILAANAFWSVALII